MDDTCGQLVTVPLKSLSLQQWSPHGSTFSVEQLYMGQSLYMRRLAAIYLGRESWT